MARLGLFSGEKKRFVQFDEDTEVLLLHIDKEALTEITKKAAKAARISGGDAKEIFNQRLGRAAVLGWRNVDNHAHPGLIVDNQPFPYSTANVDLLMRKSLEFSSFVNSEACDSVQFLDIDDEGNAVKNA